MGELEGIADGYGQVRRQWRNDGTDESHYRREEPYKRHAGEVRSSNDETADGKETLNGCAQEKGRASAIEFGRGAGCSAHSFLRLSERGMNEPTSHGASG